MKKTLLLLTLLFCFINIFSQKNIDFNSSIDFGYENYKISGYHTTTIHYLQDDNDIDITNKVYYNEIKPYFANLIIGSKFRCFELNIENKTYFQKAEKYMFKPNQINYLINLKYNYKNKLHIGYEHMCSHSADIQSMNMGYDKIYMKVVLF